MIRCEGQHFGQSRLSRAEKCRPVICEVASGSKKVDNRATVQCLDIAGVEQQGLFKKGPRLRQMPKVTSLFKRALPWKYKSIASGWFERCARRASAFVNWTFRV